MTSPQGQLPPAASVWHFPARLARIVDGDTLDVTLDRGFYTTTETRLRLYGVDTAETYGTPKESSEHRRGVVHREFVREWCDAAAIEYIDHTTGESRFGAWPFSVYTLRDKGKYGRWLADVCRRTDGNSLVSALHNEFGSEVAYSG